MSHLIPYLSAVLLRVIDWYTFCGLIWPSRISISTKYTVDFIDCTSRALKSAVLTSKSQVDINCTSEVNNEQNAKENQFTISPTFLDCIGPGFKIVMQPTKRGSASKQQ